MYPLLTVDRSSVYYPVCGNEAAVHFFGRSYPETPRSSACECPDLVAFYFSNFRLPTNTVLVYCTRSDYRPVGNPSNCDAGSRLISQVVGPQGSYDVIDTPHLVTPTSN